MARTGIKLESRRVTANLDRLAAMPDSPGARALMLALAEAVASAIRRNAPSDTGRLKRAIKAGLWSSVSDLPTASFVSIGPEGWYWFLLEFGTVNMPPRPFVADGLRLAIPAVNAGMKSGFARLLGASIQ